MKVAIVSYDLKNTRSSDDNRKVKEALEEYAECSTVLQGKNILSRNLQWLQYRLPDTTALFYITDPSISEKDIGDEVIKVIQEQGATPDKVFVAFLDIQSQDFIWDSAATPLR